MFYYMSSTGSITAIDPDLASPTNTFNTGIPNPPGGGAIAFMPSINGGTFSPTFYTVYQGNYHYWNGAAWTSTGHGTGHANAVNIGGCAGYIFNLAGPPPVSIYSYSGTATGSLLTTVPGSPSADVVTDCNCNFYIFNSTSLDHSLYKYSPQGTLLTTYSLTGLPNTSGGAGFVIMGNDVYYPYGPNSTWYKGVIGTGLSISFTTLTISMPGNMGADYACCPASSSLTPVTGTLSSIGILCPSQTVTITAATTNTGVVYSWSGPGIVGAAGNSLVTINTSGTYTCVIGTTICPQAQVTLTLAIPDGPCISVSSTSITCASLGSATVTSLYGTGPFSYTWMPSAQTNSVATGLTPGTYTIRVFDFANNSTYTATTVFTSLIPLTGILHNVSAVSCNGAATGTANYTNISGGSGNQNYLWTNGTGTSTATAPVNLTAGTWTSTVTDALTGCTINNTFVISQPPALTLTAVASTPTACAGTNIILTGTNSGGVPGYSYSWLSGPTTNTFSVTQLTSGVVVYTLNGQDANNCSVSTIISVTFVPNPVVTVLSTAICPLQTGTLYVTGASSYTWSNTTQGNAFADSPLSTTQYVVVGSALGCTAVASGSIVVKAIPVPTLVTNGPLCNGDDLQLSGSGGISYSWAGPASFFSGVQNPTINPVGTSNAGLYTLTVTAANNCTALATANVAVYPTPTLSVMGSTVCTGQTIVLSGSSVTGATFLWSGPLSFSSGLQNISITTASLSQAGPYTLTVTSVNGCTNTATTIVSVVPPPALGISLSSNSMCAQALSGSPNTIVLNSSGAASYTLSTPNHIYNNNPSGPSSPLSLTPPYQPTGPATATLFGSNGVCTVSTTVVFTIVPNPTVSIVSSTPVICAGQSFTYTSAGASSYTWSAINPGSYFYTTGNTVVSNPSINAVFSVVGGSLGCNSALQSSNITVNPLPVFSVAGNTLICAGTTAIMNAFGTATSYSWAPGVFLNTINGASVIANPPSLQNYLVTGSLNNCTTTAMVTVSVLSLPLPVIDLPKSAVCLNETLTLQGYGGNYYHWQGPNNFYSHQQNVVLLANNISYSGNYSLTVTDRYGCINKTSTSVLIKQLPAAALSGELQGCEPFCTDLHLAANHTVKTGWIYKQQRINGNDLACCFEWPGSFYLMATLVDTVTGCQNELPYSVQVYPKPLADFSFFPDQPLEGMDEVIFTNTSSGVSINTWNWFFINNKGYQTTSQNPKYLFENFGTFPIALVVKNTWGCTDSVIKTITVEPDVNLFIPNAFTPNDDNLNDVFMPVCRSIKSYKLQIFDRWGARIFESADLLTGWDGTFKGEPAKMDVYVWKIDIISHNGKTKNLNGHVNLVR